LELFLLHPGCSSGCLTTYPGQEIPENINGNAKVKFGPTDSDF
jgi:hypothetical protein